MIRVHVNLEKRTIRIGDSVIEESEFSIGEDGILTILGNKIVYSFSMEKIYDEAYLDTVEEDSIQEEKPLFGKPRKFVRYYFKMKERKPFELVTNNWVIRYDN